MNPDVKAALVAHIPTIMDLLLPLALALVSWLAARAAAWLKARTKHEKVATVLLRLSDAAQTAVREVEQTMRPLVTQVTADGKVTREEADQLKGAARLVVRRYLGAKGWIEARHVLGLDGAQLEDAVNAKIEAAVADMRLAHREPTQPFARLPR